MANQQGFSEEKKIKNKETNTILGFIISILGCIMAVGGAAFCYAMVIVEVYMAKEGLQTSKNKLAYATLIIAVVTLLLSIFTILVPWIK